MAWKDVYLLSIWALTQYLPGSYMFNIDIRSPVIHTGPRGSMFGFAVAQHIDQGTSWLLVGAPTAQTIQANIRHGGAVYRCPTDDRTACQTIPFDERGNNIQHNGSHFVPMENKSHQWFGATLSTSGKNGVIAACAPRYVYFSNNLDRREPVGACFVSTSSSMKFKHYSPCMDGRSGYHWQGHCQAGFSAALTADGSRMAMGAVGSFYWQGQLFSLDVKHEAPVNQTKEGPPSNDDSYKGYSVAVGQFTEDKIQDYVVGIPRGDRLKGMIALYMANLTQIANVSGDQMGEYFGHSLAVGDFNGDGYDDVASGAPFYSSAGGPYETGRVYLLYQTSQHTLSPVRTLLYGTKTESARFGFAVTSMGDVNRDGFGDIAVGAPYGGDNGRGVVFIFHGSTLGMQTKPSQVVQATSVDPFAKTFGYSLSGGADLDRNTYSDLLIGAYESDKAVYLRARPIIKVNVQVNIRPAILDLDFRRCTLPDGTQVVCFTVETCLSYVGHKVPGSIDLDIFWHMEAQKTVLPRASFFPAGQATETMTVSLSKRKRKCKTSEAFLKASIRDKLSPVAVNVTYGLVDVRPPFGELAPILDQYIPTTTTTYAHIKKNCGPDHICVPDLRIRTEGLTTDYVLGTTGSPLEVVVQVANHGEDAFEAKVSITIPPGTSYVNVFNIQSISQVKCAAPDNEANNVTGVLVCDIGNPLMAQQQISFGVRVSPTDVTGSSRTLTFEFHVDSSNSEKRADRDNNFSKVRIPVRAVVDIRMTGVSQPEQVIYNSTSGYPIDSEKEIGPELIHLYEVRNLGPSTVGDAVVEIYWPSYLENGDHLLYLTVTPRVLHGRGFCTSDSVNPRNITVSENSGEGFEPVVSERLARRLPTTRWRRAVLPEDESPALSARYNKRDVDPKKLIKRVVCSRPTEECTVIRCWADTIRPGDNVLIKIHARVWTHSLRQLPYRALIVSSKAITQVLAVPYDIRPDDYPIQAFQVDTFVAALDAGPERGYLEIWVIALAISGGVVLLLLLTLLLWRCGFFKREKPEDMQRFFVNRHTNGHSTAAHYDAIPTDQL